MLNIQKNYPMESVTTLEIGGPAQEFIVVKTEEDLIKAIKYAKEKNLDFLVIGGASNLLVSDEGVNKLVIKNEASGIRKNDKLVVKAGTPLQDLVDFTISHGFSGMQKLTGIAGTVGGAVYGNAGAYGQTISDYITEVKVLDPYVIPAKVLRSRSPQDRGAGIHTNKQSHGSHIKYGMIKEECKFGYRDSVFKKNGLTILEVTFQLTQTNSQDLKKESQEILAKRLPKYPLGIKCPGSFFKNILAVSLPEHILKQIPKDKIPYGKVSVGYLLETVGAKGDRLGNIEIAPYHGNLFINKGGGKAYDFYKLAKKYAKKVYEKFGIILEPEVQLINVPPINYY